MVDRTFNASCIAIVTFSLWVGAIGSLTLAQEQGRGPTIKRWTSSQSDRDQQCCPRAVGADIVADYRVGRYECQAYDQPNCGQSPSGEFAAAASP